MNAEILEEFQEVGRLLWEAGLVSSHGGNLSRRLPEGGILITCHGAMLGRIQEGDLLAVAPDGSAHGDPSLDTALHLAIYERTEAQAVVHAHPRHAIALSLVGATIEPQDLEGKHYLGDLIPVVTTDELAATMQQYPIVVTPGHGSYGGGDNLWEALQRTSVLEESAQVIWLLKGLS